MTERLPEREIEQRAENFVRALHVRRLLINVCGPVYSRPETNEHWEAIGGGYTEGYGALHEEAPSWPSLEACFSSHPGVVKAIREAETLGLLNAHFASSGESNLHAFYCIFCLAEDACDRIRAKAFADRTMFPGNAEEWQEKFDLYLKQNWIRDAAERERWRTQYPLVDWPSTPKDLWPLTDGTGIP